MRHNISKELEQSMSNKLLEATKAAGLNFYLNLNFWKSKITDTGIPSCLLEPAEVDVINRKYLGLKVAFDAKEQVRVLQGVSMEQKTL